jgi:hypothetical protein
MQKIFAIPARKRSFALLLAIVPLQTAWPCFELFSISSDVLRQYRGHHTQKQSATATPTRLWHRSSLAPTAMKRALFDRDEQSASCMGGAAMDLDDVGDCGEAAAAKGQTPRCAAKRTCSAGAGAASDADIVAFLSALSRDLGPGAGRGRHLPPRLLASLAELNIKLAGPYANIGGE